MKRTPSGGRGGEVGTGTARAKFSAKLKAKREKLARDSPTIANEEGQKWRKRNGIVLVFEWRGREGGKHRPNCEQQTKKLDLLCDLSRPSAKSMQKPNNFSVFGTNKARRKRKWTKKYFKFNIPKRIKVTWYLLAFIVRHVPPI